MSNLIPVEYRAERVLTTEQLAQAYECGTDNIKRNFSNNKEHFEEGKHFFKLEGDELKDLRGKNIHLQISPKTRCLYLWTRRGASRHSKMLGTDRAWEMFDALEENYFNPRPKALTPAEQMAQGLLAAQKLLAEKDKRIEEMRPKEIFADAVSVSKTDILIGDLAKLIKQNGHDIGQKRLFAWLREKGYLIKRKGLDWNMPTQRAMEMKLFRVKETVVTHSDGHTTVSKTPKVTGKGQVYFVNKFLARGE
ncbi:phage antirepressor KilAC domain-containing protein [Selenomonas bovis]|uniref:phage antirepressor KilAC domain-containing protein n=1 Tax=Selenomonas bovis TaxID=416586 RepID=UPI00035F8005|nr:phage antirepressor KilAC domain-containing protein [Selenomonas bovis]